MRRTLLILWLATVSGCNASGRIARPLDVLKRSPLHGFSEADLDAYLRWLAARPMTTGQRMEHLARKSIGQRYQAFLLGEYPYELYDPDPMYCLSASDCVTFVEQTCAMALSSDWPSFFKTLQRIRYNGGIVGIRTRNHFTEGDWNPANAWLFEEVTDALAPNESKPMQTRIDRAGFFAKFGIKIRDPPRIVHGSYIPADRLDTVTSALQDGDLIEFVRGNGEWLSVTHLGLLFHDAAGRPTLLHSGRPAVHELPLEKYLSAHPIFVGFKILRLRDSK